MDFDTFTPVTDVGEFGLIDRMAATLGPPDDDALLVGISDDAAVYRGGDGMVHVLTTDALIEGIHFDLQMTPPSYLGAKAISVNVSDVVAMNARPRYATVVLGIPHSVSTEMVEALYTGMRQACEAYGVTVVGGDTTAARSLTLAVTVVGMAREQDVVYRSGARPGDLMCVTGDLGGAYAGLNVLLGNKQALEAEGEDYTPDLESYQYVIRRQLTPAARLGTLDAWAASGVRPRALIDVSDGLASEVHHLCKHSGCGALIRTKAIPIDLVTRRVADQLQDDADAYALYGGEDYELLFALDPSDAEKLDPASFFVVGTCTEAAEGVLIETPEGKTLPLEQRGYRHFG